MANILLVEDQVKLGSRLPSHRVWNASSGPEATSICRHQSIDIAVVGSVLRDGASGADLAQRLVAAHPGLRLLLIVGGPPRTGRQVANRTLEAVSKTSFRVLKAPIRFQVLEQKIRELEPAPGSIVSTLFKNVQEAIRLVIAAQRAYRARNGRAAILHRSAETAHYRLLESLLEVSDAEADLVAQAFTNFETRLFHLPRASH